MSLWQAVRTRLIEPVRKAQGSPRSFARGFALGTWLAFTPTVGIQMALVAAIGIPWKANIPIAIALVWISNPLTVIPMYYAYYWLGTLLLGVETRSYGELAGVLLGIIRAAQRSWSGFVDSLETLGSEVLWPLVLGSVLIATVLAFPAYHLGRWLGRRRQGRLLREQADAMLVQEGSDAAPPEEIAPP